LFELFTNGFCETCVAAEAALSALEKTYAKSELVVLRYQQNKPGPDPLANEESDFAEFIRIFTDVLDFTGSGKVYLIVDKVSKDRTFQLCEELSLKGPRYVTIWAPENRSLVDAYLRGFREAVNQGIEWVRGAFGHMAPTTRRADGSASYVRSQVPTRTL